MNIAIYLSKAMYLPENEGVGSGHVQIALKTAEVLSNLGHNITLITTTAPKGYKIPASIRSDKLALKLVTSGTKDWPKHRKINLLRAPKLFLELKKFLSQKQYDVLHFFGSNKSAYLLAFLKVMGVRGKTILTFTNYSYINNIIHKFFLKRILINYIDYSIASTYYVKQKLERFGFKLVYVNRPGLLNLNSQMQTSPIKIRPEAEDLVLFWRDAEYSNGVDICIEAYKRLSKEFEKVDFVFAVRPKHSFEKRLLEIDKQYKNIHLLLYPYSNGITIEKLLASSSCVVMPFRKLSLNPQMVLLETLSAGKPLVTTKVESNGELVDNSEAIYFVESENVDETYSAIKFLLKNKTLAKKMGEKAKIEVSRKWNWQEYAERLKDIYAEINSDSEKL